MKARVAELPSNREKRGLETRLEVVVRYPKLLEIGSAAAWSEKGQRYHEVVHWHRGT
jgi:hypothetical protein